MSPSRKAFLACLAAGAIAVVFAPHAAARSPSGGSHGAGARHGSHGGGGHHGGGYPVPSWGWGIAVGIPWSPGWYEPYWYGGVYGAVPYPYPAYGYVSPSYGTGYGCGWDEECWRAQAAQVETPPTTQLPPPAPGVEGAPTQRPLHLNYCDSARAWYPNVRTCPGGWRLVRPEYNAAP